MVNAKTAKYTLDLYLLVDSKDRIPISIDRMIITMKNGHADLSKDLKTPMIKRTAEITSKETMMYRRGGCKCRGIIPVYPTTKRKMRIIRNNKADCLTIGWYLSPHLKCRT
ncbi:MAG: hypothetical protein ACFFAZ_09150 [Promethearchaeota archaeon]